MQPAGFGAGSRIAPPHPSAMLDHRNTKLSGGIDQRLPHRCGEASEHGNVIAGDGVDLPEMDANLARERNRGVAGAEFARVQVDRNDLGERVACVRAADADDGAPIRLTADRSATLETGSQA